MAIRSVIAIVLVVCSMPIWAQKTKKKNAQPQQTLFTVNNRVVTTNEFIQLYKKNNQHQEEEAFSKQKIDEYLGLFINFKLKVEEARARGYDTTEAFVKEYQQYKDELRKPYLPEGKMLDSLVKLTYNRLKEEVRVSHLLIGIKPDAPPADTLAAFNKTVELKKRVVAGEDFGTLASQYSEDPSARVNKGDLGYFTALQMVYPFEQAAYTSSPGEVVGPVRTRFGYHLLKIHDRKPARGEVEVSHIMIRTGPSQDDPRSRNTIFEIYDQLKGGVSWEELCAQYSEDLNTKNNGGRLRPFGVGAMAAAPEFDQVAFSLQKPGEISDPFQTAYGWHIVRLEKKIPLPGFDELAGSLKNRVQRDERAQLSRQALMEKLKHDFQFRENISVKGKVMAAADSSLTQGNWNVKKWPSDEILFSIKNRQVKVQEFVQHVQWNAIPTISSPAAYLDQLYQQFVEAVINNSHEEVLIRNNPDYALLLNEYYEGILLFEIMEKEVWNRASTDTVGLQKFYAAHKDNYVAGERVQAELYSGQQQESISRLKDILHANDTIALNEMIVSRKLRYEKGLFQKNDRPVFSKIDWKTGDYTLENNGMYYLVRILQMVPPGPMTLEEAKASVITDYQNYLEKQWIEQLRKKYAVKVNEKGKQAVYKSLIRS